MVRVYYDLVLWEEIDDNELNEKLKGKAQEMVKRFGGYGLVSYNMRTEIAQQQPQQVYDEQQYQEQQPQQQPEQYEQDTVQPEPPVDEQQVQDEM